MLKTVMRHYFVSLFLLLFISPSNGLSQPALTSQSQLDALWSTVPTSNEPDERHENGFVEYNGDLYLLGGRGLKRVQVFNPETNTWSDKAFPPFQMHHFQAVVYNNLIYVVGAYTGTCCDAENGISHVWTYNPQTDTWTQGHEIPAGRRRGSTGAVVYNNKIYIVGGIEGGHGDPATAYSWFDEYNPNTGQWTTLPNAPRVRDHFHATVFNDKLYLIGGRNTSVSSITGAPIGEIDIYNFSSGTWSTLAGSKNLPTPRGGPSTILYQGEILVIGGETSQDQAHDETEAFNPISESWRTLSSLVVGRHGTQAAIYDNAIYIAAGAAQKGGEPELDSVEKYEDTEVQLVQRFVSLVPGWNMAGVPLNPLDPNFQSVYDDVNLVAGAQPMTWDGSSGYEAFPTLSVGKGYWIKVDPNAQNPQSQTITGTEVNAMQIQVFEGWNMISGPSCDIFLLGSSTDPGAAIPEGGLYKFEDGYEPAFDDIFKRGRMFQGVGYWLYVTKDAILTMGCSGSKTPAPVAGITFADNEKDLGKLTVLDARNKSRQLLFDGDAELRDNGDAYNVPPRLGSGYFDARFRNHKRLTGGYEDYIKVEVSQLPYSVSFDEAPDGKAGKLVISYTKHDGTQASIDLLPGDYVDINDESADILHMQFVEDAINESPDTFMLRGNYPNPFNPTTRIVFDLPEDASISIQVVDLLGRTVKEIKNQHVAAGLQRSIQLDAHDLPAGTYLYRVTASINAVNTLTQTGSMVLLK